MQPTVITAAIVAAAILLTQIACARNLSHKLFEAPTVDASQIRSLQSSNQFFGKYVLVDVREKIETDVSVIPGAITQLEFENSIDEHRGKTVLAYCTIGYRSGIYATELAERGWDAFNYKGSILDWCNHRFPVVTPDGELTNLVHTYNASYCVPPGYQAIY